MNWKTIEITSKLMVIQELETVRETPEVITDMTMTLIYRFLQLLRD